MGDGGSIRAQKDKQHHVVIFTFSGKVSDADKTAWNKAVAELKKRFKGRVTGVTLKGVDSPPTS